LGLGLLTLLTTTQLLDTLLLVVLAVERDTDTDTSVIFDTLTWLFVRVFIVSVALIGLALDDQTATASGDQALKDGCEFLGYLLECSLDSFIFALIQDFNKVLNRRKTVIELLSSLRKTISLRGEAVILLKGLLVDTLVFLEGIIDLL